MIEILKNICRLSNSHFFNSSISNPSLQSTILLTNLGKRKRVLGQSIKYKDSNKRVVPVGPKLAIPNSYDGFFELLSEDGRSVRCIGKLTLWFKHKWSTLGSVICINLEYWNFNRSPSKLDAPISRKQFFCLNFCFE